MLLGALLVSLVVLADDPLRLAGEAYGKKDYPAFLKHMRAAALEQPTRPRVLLGLASAQALGGAPDEVAVTLERLAAMGLAFKVEGEEEFAALREQPAFKKVVAHFAANRAAVVGSAKPAFTLPGTELVEGVAYDSAKQRYFVASVRQRKIFEVTQKTGAVREFVSGEMGGVFGLAFDQKRNVLWASSAYLPQVSGFVEAEKNRSGVLKIDAKTGVVLGRWWLPQDVSHVLGEVVLAPNGEVFASESTQPVVYRFDEKQGALEKWLEGPFRSPQGLAFSPKGERLYLADYSLGLFVIDVKTKAVAKLKTPLDVASVGIDGLYFVNGALVATQNGVEPQRVMRFSLDAKGLEVTGQKVLLVGDPRVDDLSLGTVVGSQLLINAHSGWSAFDDNGTRKADAVKDSTFLFVPLN